MKDVKIQVNSAAFPDQFASDSVKDSMEYGLQIGQSIQYEWFRQDSGSCRFYNQRGEFNRLRLYARGEQSIGKYKNELSSGFTPSFTIPFIEPNSSSKKSILTLSPAGSSIPLL